MASTKRIANPVLFICDIQEKFRSAIWEYPKVIATSVKMVKAAQILNMPIYATTQNAARLGATVSEITSLLPTASASDTTTEVDKTAFSMLVPQLTAQLPSGPLSVVMVGIETHICVTQTALDLLRAGRVRGDDERESVV